MLITRLSAQNLKVVFRSGAVSLRENSLVVHVTMAQTPWE